MRRRSAPGVMRSERFDRTCGDGGNARSCQDSDQWSVHTHVRSRKSGARSLVGAGGPSWRTTPTPSSPLHDPAIPSCLTQPSVPAEPRSRNAKQLASPSSRAAIAAAAMARFRSGPARVPSNRGVPPCSQTSSGALRRSLSAAFTAAAGPRAWKDTRIARARLDEDSADGQLKTQRTRNEPLRRRSVHSRHRLLTFGSIVTEG
jgi:hypothetical protein